MAQNNENHLRIDTFGFLPGRKLAGKYIVESLIGAGWEGEVYKLYEISTGITRAAKFFFPHRNPRNNLASWHAKKLHKLRHCPIIIQYQTQETIIFKRTPITFLVSEYVEGEILPEFLKRQSGKRLNVFEGLHFLHTLAS
ncbi:MAG: serine/threonine protein kinase, partial [Candidatus Latescibacterota bacterium]